MTQNRMRFIKPIGELFKCVVNWFEGPYVDYVILHPIVRWVVLAFFLSLSIVFVSFAVQLRPDEEQVSTKIYHRVAYATKIFEMIFNAENNPNWI